MKEVSWEEYRHAKKEEKKLERQHAKLKREGEKKPYLQERDTQGERGRERERHIHIYFFIYIYIYIHTHTHIYRPEWIEVIEP